MYTTTVNYKNKVYLASTKHILNIYVDGVKIDDKILDFKITNDLFTNDEFTLGTVASKMIEIKFHKASLPIIYKTFYIESGIENEVIPIGYFTLDSIKEDDDTVIIKAIDNMSKFEKKYNGSAIILPATLMDVLKDICIKIGVELRFYFFFKSRKTNKCV